MIKLKRFNEHSQPATYTKLSAFGSDFFVEASSHGWRTGQLVNGKFVKLSECSSKAQAFSDISRAAVRLANQSINSINENGTPSWIENSTTKIISNPNILKFGAIDEIVNHEHGVTLLFKDIEFSAELDDLNYDASLLTDVSVEVVFSNFNDEETGLIDIGLQEYPIRYSIDIVIETNSWNDTITEFSAQDWKSWYFSPDEISEMANDGDPGDAVVKILFSQISTWYEKSKASTMLKLEKLAKTRSRKG
jgi:hypothetical protein